LANFNDGICHIKNITCQEEGEYYNNVAYSVNVCIFDYIKYSILEDIQLNDKYGDGFDMPFLRFLEEIFVKRSNKY
jgi:hypothetical protein